jgi:hypothetical protein
VWSSSDHLGAIGDWLFHPTVVAHVQVRNTGNTFFNMVVAWRVVRRRRRGGGRRSGKVAAPSPWMSSGSGI